MTAERLAELRSVLAALADQPIATLEVHPLPDGLDRSQGISLDAVSPLAQHLSQLITQSAHSSSTAAKATAAGEGLYHMVVPAKVAAQLGQGLVRPMASKAVAGGIRGPLVNSRGGIVAGATFMPVGKAAAAGAAGGAGATAGVAAAAHLRGARRLPRQPADGDPPCLNDGRAGEPPPVILRPQWLAPGHHLRSFSRCLNLALLLMRRTPTVLE